ncbi:MAG TPA: hypothetical protein VGN26_16705 [Armatimonadota bacterium]|jgi:hypothetical protein
MDASFISLPRPVVAASDSPEGRSLIARVLRDYRQDLCVNDKRLTRKIDLWMPRGELQDLVGQLQAETGIDFSVRDDLATLKVCVLVRQQPIRDIMNQVVKLLNLEWLREGKEPTYRYTLSQSLEQKMAGMTEVASIDAVATGMKQVMRLAASSKAELTDHIRELQEQAAHPKAGVDLESLEIERRLCESFARGYQRAEVEGFRLLTPRQLADLANYHQVTLEHHPGGVGDTLPPSLVSMWLSSDLGGSGRSMVPPDLTPDQLTLSVSYFLRRTLTNRLELRSLAMATYPPPKDQPKPPVPQRFPGSLLSEGHLMSLSPVSAAGLRWRRTTNLGAYPWLAQPVSCSPDAIQPKSPRLAETARTRLKEGRVEATSFYVELSRASGKPVVAEYGTRVYPRPPFAGEHVALRELLDSACGAMAADWQADGPFLRVRRRAFMMEQALDVPRRVLLRLSSSAERQGYAGLDELADLALVDDSHLIPQALLDGLEWLYAGGDQWWMGASRSAMLRLYARLSPEQRRRAASREGLSTADLTPEQRRWVRDELPDWDPISRWQSQLAPDDPSQLRFRRTKSDWGLTEEDFSKGRFWIRLMLPGFYEWTDQSKTPGQYPPPFDPDIKTTTRAEAEAQMQRLLRSRGRGEGMIRDQKMYVYDPPKGPYPTLVARLNFGGIDLREYGGNTSSNFNRPLKPRTPR